MCHTVGSKEQIIKTKLEKKLLKCLNITTKDWKFFLSLISSENVDQLFQIDWSEALKGRTI